jgi:hypothetical protein
VAEGCTSDEYERLMTITVIERRRNPFNETDGDGTEAMLVRDGNGLWGWTSECDEERADEDYDGIDRVMVDWCINEATARRAYLGQIPSEQNCDACGLNMDSEDGRLSPEGNIVVCPGCWVTGGDFSVEVYS